MSQKPISLAKTNVLIKYQSEWEVLRDQAGAKPVFDPLEVKAFYVYGLIYDICQSVQVLLSQDNAWPDLYLPAYVIFASGIELMGRCLRGDNEDRGQSGNNLKTGFNYLVTKRVDMPANPELMIVMVTNHHHYNVTDMIALRNFTAHGQATNNNLRGVDLELLNNFPTLIGDAMEVYWKTLQTSDDLCEKLGRANIRPLRNRSAPIKKILQFFAEGGAGKPFYGFNWTVYP